MKHKKTRGMYFESLNKIRYTKINLLKCGPKIRIFKLQSDLWELKDCPQFCPSCKSHLVAQNCMGLCARCAKLARRYARE